MQSIAAERIWYAASPHGSDGELILRVSIPIQSPDMDFWACTVSLGLLEPLSHTIYGTDSWQALYLSMIFVVRRISDFAEKGWKFYWEKDGDPAEAEELIYAPKTF